MINPNTSAAKYVAERLTGNMIDEEQRKWVLFNYVRDNIEYKHDPNWLSDWVYNPTYTLTVKKGDCDDHAVLLASLFMQAGIQDVQLCFTPNHAYVAVGETGWDATCKNCTTTSMGEEKYYENSRCQEITSYLRLLQQ